MLISELIEKLEQYPQDAEICIRYGRAEDYKVSDIGLELVYDDMGIGDHYRICASGYNIRSSFVD